MSIAYEAGKNETWKIGMCVGAVLLGIGLVGMALTSVARDTPEEKERMIQLVAFDKKCFAVRGRSWFDNETHKHECYNGPNLVFSKEIK